MQNNFPLEAQEIERMMFSLMAELQHLAPHPDYPDYSGPLFVRIDGAYAPSAEYDSMAGSMIMDSLLGASFASAAGQTVSHIANAINWSNVAESASAYWCDRSTAKSRPCTGFNAAARKVTMDAFLADLPRRLGIERWIAEYQRKLYGLRKNARHNVPALAA